MLLSIKFGNKVDILSIVEEQLLHEPGAAQRVGLGAQAHVVLRRIQLHVAANVMVDVDQRRIWSTEHAEASPLFGCFVIVERHFSRIGQKAMLARSNAHNLLQKLDILEAPASYVLVETIDVIVQYVRLVYGTNAKAKLPEVSILIVNGHLLGGAGSIPTLRIVLAEHNGQVHLSTTLRMHTHSLQCLHIKDHIDIDE